MKRTFIAVKILPGKTVIDILHDFKRIPGDKIKWVNLDVMHITLNFLGDTKEDMIPEIIEIIKKVSVRYPSMQLEFSGIGLFRNIRDPRVIWIGMQENKILSEIKYNLDLDLKKLGFRMDDRAFRPHLTLGRVKYIRNRDFLEDLLVKYKEKKVQVSDISEIIYYESILKPEGPEYIPLYKAKLGK